MWRMAAVRWLLPLLLIVASMPAVLYAEEPGPTESECRPYIEKALKQLETPETIESTGSGEDTASLEVDENEQLISTPEDSTEPGIEESSLEESLVQDEQAEESELQEGAESQEGEQISEEPTESEGALEESQEEDKEGSEGSQEEENKDTESQEGEGSEIEIESSKAASEEEIEENEKKEESEEEAKEGSGEEAKDESEEEAKEESGEEIKEESGEEGKEEESGEEGKEEESAEKAKEEESAEEAKEEESAEETKEEEVTEEAKEEESAEEAKDESEEEAKEASGEEIKAESGEEAKEEESAEEAKEEESAEEAKEEESAEEAKEEEVTEETESVEGVEETSLEEKTEGEESKERTDDSEEEKKDESQEDETVSEEKKDDEENVEQTDTESVEETTQGEESIETEEVGDEERGIESEEGKEESLEETVESDSTEGKEEKSEEDTTEKSGEIKESKEDKEASEEGKEESKEVESEEVTAESVKVSEASPASEEEAAPEAESQEQGEESAEESKGDSESKEAQEESPEEDLTLDFEIPENLRRRDHIAEILKLTSESAERELLLSKTIDNTLRELKRIYDSAIKPLELLYKYRDLSNRHFGDPEIFSKPLILFMGPWSGGKSTIINYLLDNEFKQTSLRTGAEPSPAYFNILMHGEDNEILDGTQLAADWTFSGLQKFGQGLLDRLRGLRLASSLLEKVNIVEIPGILEIRKQVERVFPFNDACQWFIDRADIIFLVYDPSKLDVGPETEAILDQLKGREYQTRIILNKADQVKPEELMRVQGTLIWNISPLMSSPEPPVMYSTSLWSIPYEVGAPVRLLTAQERAFLRDFRQAVDRRVENKISSARRFAVRVRNHAKMVDCYLTTYYNHMSFFGNKKKVSDGIVERPQDYHIYEGLSTLTNISRYDLPDPDVYRDFFRLNALYEFQQLSATCTYFRGCPINRLDVAIAYDLPELVGKYKKSVEHVLTEAKKSQS